MCSMVFALACKGWARAPNVFEPESKLEDACEGIFKVHLAILRQNGL